MGKIDSAQKYIDECTACLEAKDSQMAEKLENTIVGVYSKDIDGIKVGLDRYRARVVPVGKVIIYDYLGDIELLKAKLIHYKEELEAEACKIDNRTSIPAININNVNKNSNSANASNCIRNKNKPPALQVCSQIALASSKTSCDIMSAGSPTARNYITGGIQDGQEQFSTYAMGM